MVYQYMPTRGTNLFPPIRIRCRNMGDCMLSFKKHAIQCFRRI